MQAARRPRGFMMLDGGYLETNRRGVAFLWGRLGIAVFWSFRSLDAAGARETRKAFVQHLKTFCAVDMDYDAAESIFGELVANAVRHAPGPIRVHVDWTNERPRLCVLDSGRGFDLTPATILESEPLPERGRGLLIVGALGDDVQIKRPADGGCEVSVLLRTRKK